MHKLKLDHWPEHPTPSSHYSFVTRTKESKNTLFINSKSYSACGPKDLLLMLKSDLTSQGLKLCLHSVLTIQKSLSAHQRIKWSFIWTEAAAAVSAVFTPAYKSIVSANSPCQALTIIVLQVEGVMWKQSQRLGCGTCFSCVGNKLPSVRLTEQEALPHAETGAHLEFKHCD